MNTLRRRAPRCARWVALLLLALPATALMAQDSTPEVTPLVQAEPTLEVTSPAEATTPEVTPSEIAPSEMTPATEATESLPEATAVPVDANGGEAGGIVTAAGSGILAPLVQRTADGAGVPVELVVNGSTRGLNALCSNSADLGLATRALSNDEEALCSNNGVGFTELLVGYDVVAFVMDANSTIAQCIAAPQLSMLFAPSSAGQILDWQQVNPVEAAVPLTVIVPPSNAPGFALLDTLVEGDGFRDDAVALSGSEAISALAGNAGAIAVVPLSVAAQAGDAVRILNIDSGTGCAAPSTVNAANGSYSLASPLYVYANLNSLDKTGLRDLLTALTTDAADSALSEAFFSAPSAAERAQNAEALSAGSSGRVFSRTLTTYTILPNVAGAVTVAGSANGFTFIQAATTAFNAQYPGVAITSNIDGQTAGFRQLCNREVDAVFAYSELSGDAAAACTASNTTPETYSLGSQVAVLVSNSANDYLQCMTATDLATAWRAASASTVTNWSAVNPVFPNTALTLFAPNQGSMTTDILMLATTGGDDPSRADVQFSDNAGYRAAAVANVDGSMALLSWAEYQAMLTAGQERVQVVAIDTGSGCVEPSLSTIADGSYALARPVFLIVSRIALARSEVQGVVWYLAQDAQLAQYDAAGFIGLTPDALAERRAQLETTFAETGLEAAAAAQAALEATPEATLEAALEMTPAVEMTAETAP